MEGKTLFYVQVCMCVCVFGGSGGGGGGGGYACLCVLKPVTQFSHIRAGSYHTHWITIALLTLTGIQSLMTTIAWLVVHLSSYVLQYSIEEIGFRIWDNYQTVVKLLCVVCVYTVYMKHTIFWGAILPW